MGHSYIDLDGRSVLLNDTDIDLARHFLTESGEAVGRSDWPPGTLSDFRAFIDGWSDIAPGVYGADLGQFVLGDPVRRAFLSSALAVADERVRGFGEGISVEYLRASIPPSGRVYEGGYPVRLVLQALTELRRLVDGSA